MRKFKIYPNAYYNYLKDRKNPAREEKCVVQRKIVEIYHKEDGVPGYRMMRDYLRQSNINYSNTTIYGYMKELGLRSIVRKRRPDYKKGSANKIFPNLLNRNFTTDEPNKIWCTDFTYLPQKDGTFHYNCTIIDLYDRSVIATLNGSNITARLAIETLEIAIKRHKPGKGIILHSDQGTQFTAKEFNDYCENNHIQQSMSRAGCPYDNAPMERFYNTLKNEYLYLYKFNSIKELYDGITEFSYVKYNHKRPHSYNGGLTPSVARHAK